MRKCQRLLRISATLLRLERLFVYFQGQRFHTSKPMALIIIRSSENVISMVFWIVKQ
jgi:hypothetical protein